MIENETAGNLLRTNDQGNKQVTFRSSGIIRYNSFLLFATNKSFYTLMDVQIVLRQRCDFSFERRIPQQSIARPFSKTHLILISVVIYSISCDKTGKKYAVVKLLREQQRPLYMFTLQYYDTIYASSQVYTNV